MHKRIMMITKVWRGVCKFCTFLFVPQMGRRRRKREALRRDITYLMGQERADGNLQPLSADYISRALNVPLTEVEEVMKTL